jgi:hypothetical protein
MPSELKPVDPYQPPTPYDVLGIRNGLRASARDIGKAYNDAKKKARHIKDTKERAARMEELERAKEQLQRPDDRVLVDFFLLGDDVFGDLCIQWAQELGAREIATGQLLGPLLPKQPYDDLLPRPLEQFVSDYRWLDDLKFHDEPEAAPPRVPLVEIAT